VIGFTNADDLKRLDISAKASGGVTRRVISSGWLLLLMFPSLL
jgi:hypothetical protein